jgi:hypothetical protein
LSINELSEIISALNGDSRALPKTLSSISLTSDFDMLGVFSTFSKRFANASLAFISAVLIAPLMELPGM